jgi:predicted CoA-binding protein
VIETIATVNSINELPNPTKTALSIITPPKVTLKVLEDAKKIGIQNIWIQPGGEDEKVIAFINENKSVLNVIFGGPCILVKGSSLLQNYKNHL